MPTALFDPRQYSYVFSAWPPFIVGFSFALLGISVFIRERASKVSQAFLGLTGAGGLWLLAIGMAYSAREPSLTLTWLKVEHLGVVFIPSAFLCFTLLVVRHFNRFRWIARLCLLASAGFAVNVFFSDRFIGGIAWYPWGPYPQYGPSGSLFLGFFFYLYGACLALYWKAARRCTSGIQQDRLKSLLLAFGVGMLGAVDYLACYHIAVYPIGYLPVYACILRLAQVIWQYRFPDVTPAFAASQIVQTIPSALLVLDHDGVICVANETACRLFERSQEALIGQSAHNLFTAFLPAGEKDPSFLDGSTHEYEVSLRISSGPPRICRFSTSVIRDGEQRPLAYVCLGQDVTDRKKMEEDLRAGRERFRLLVDGVKDHALIILDLAGHVVSWNAGAQRIKGYRADEIVGKHFSVFYPSEDALQGKPQKELNVAIRDGRVEDEGWRIRKDGSRFWAHVIITALYDAEGRLRGFAKVTRDVTERDLAEKALRSSQSRFRRLVDSNIIGFMLVNADGLLLEANDALLKMLGYSREDLANGKVEGPALTPPEYRTVDQWMAERVKMNGVCPPIEKEYIRKDGSRIAMLVGMVRLEEHSGQALCFLIDASERREAQDALQQAYDELELRVNERTAELSQANAELAKEVEQRKRAEAALQNLSITDPLTGLYNRRGFNTLAEPHLELARRRRKGFLIFMADLDGLKPINDQYGHAEGDFAIVSAGGLLKKTFRESDIVARIGGDEFAVVAIEDSEQTAENLFARLQEKIDDFNRYSGRHYRLGLSMGAIRMDPQKALTLDQLMAQADEALYEKKKRGSLQEKLSGS